MEITLYTISCPKCIILEKQLKNKGIKYNMIEDTGVMINKGIDKLPVLEINGKLMNYAEAFKWTSEQ